MKSTIVATATGLALIAGCGGDPADVAGTYTISLTNRENGCNNPNWTEGESTAGVMVDLTQNDEAVTGDVLPAAGGRLALDAVLGGHLFTGTIDGDDLDLLIVGTPSFSQGTCDFTIDAQLAGSADGDSLSGNIYYRAQTDGSNECGALTGCASKQEFLGNRPPS